MNTVPGTGQVIATSRGRSAGLDKLVERYPTALEIASVDTVDLTSVRALRRRIEGRRLDALFVNAGICRANESTPSEVEEKDFLDMMLTNALSPMRVVEVFLPSAEAWIACKRTITTVGRG
ncbi:MAG TPA: SDR family NAD(P)-dependent oxidoreductase [Blastocatellia bacterium]|nr:SDR family NAD(P)-dependent oxidoreductase [Blastocatellia bacterium]